MILAEMLSGHLAAAGTSPGRLIETDNNFNIIGEHPEDVASQANIVASQFSPHGLSVDFDKNLILTSDYVVPLSVLKPSLGIIRANTLRLWNLATKSIISTITIPNVSCTISVKHLISKYISTRHPMELTEWHVELGRRNSRRQVHPWKQRLGSSRHCCASWSSLDHLSIQARSQWSTGNCRTALWPGTFSSRHYCNLVSLLCPAPEWDPNISTIC